MSKLQNDTLRFRIDHINISKWTAIGLSLITCTVFLYSDQVILLLYGEKWLQASIYLRLLTIASYFSVIEIVSGNLFRIFNKTKNMFYVEILKKIVQAISIGIGIFYHSIEVLLYGLIVTSIVGYFLSFVISKRLVIMNLAQVKWDLLKIIAISCFCTLLMLLLFQAFGLKGNWKLSLLIILPLTQILLIHILKLEDVEKFFKKIFKITTNINA